MALSPSIGSGAFLLKKDGADGDPKAIEAEAEADPEASDNGPLRPRIRFLLEQLVGQGIFFPRLRLFKPHIDPLGSTKAIFPIS